MSAPFSVIVRSVIFQVLFYLATAILAIVGLPVLLMPRATVLSFARLWARVNLWLLRVVCGLEYEIRGHENLPPGPLVVASKHQSMWETFALVLLFDDPAIILKRELWWIPFFGWYLRRAGTIAIDRGRAAQALIRMTAAVRTALAQDRQVIIFPEGTRRAPGAPPDYKLGAAHLYAETGAACLPIALNSGLFWPRRSYLRLPGCIVVDLLPPIPPGLNKREFLVRVRDDIERASASLAAEGERSLRARGIAPIPAAPEG
jgi:1-acyl-sn-glycerol-3-phosphate acyltransferase